MTEPTIHNLELFLDEATPQYMEALRSQTEWSWQEDDQGRTFFALEYLRIWLLDDSGSNAAAVWAAVEPLMETRDPVLLNALAVGLLEGHWSKRHLALMGPKTRALYDELWG